VGAVTSKWLLKIELVIVPFIKITFSGVSLGSIMSLNSPRSSGLLTFKYTIAP